MPTNPQIGVVRTLSVVLHTLALLAAASAVGCESTVIADAGPAYDPNADRGAARLPAPTPGADPTPQTSPAPPSDQPAPAANPSGVPDVYWLVTYAEAKTRSLGQGDLNNQLEVERAGIRRDAVVLYQWQLGEFPFEGPHKMLRDPAWLARHLNKVRSDTQRWVPAGFRGVVVIDYETWDVRWDDTHNRASSDTWDARDRDHKDDWIEALRIVAPERMRGLEGDELERVARETYEAATRKIYLETLAAARSARPTAKWGYFHYPRRLYASSKTPGGTIGYPEASRGLGVTKANDELSWLIDAVDVVLPAPYAPRITISDEAAQRLRMPRSERHNERLAERYYRSNIREAVRMARGKPVIAMLRLRYIQDDETWLRADDLEMPLEIAAEEGAQGIMLWEHVRDPEDYRQLRTQADAVIKPTIARVRTEIENEARNRD